MRCTFPKLACAPKFMAVVLSRSVQRLQLGRLTSIRLAASSFQSLAARATAAVAHGLGQGTANLSAPCSDVSGLSRPRFVRAYTCTQSQWLRWRIELNGHG